jgi:hypothetical protein
MKVNGTDFNPEAAKKLNEQKFIDFWKGQIWQNIEESERIEKLRTTYNMLTGNTGNNVKKSAGKTQPA